jgi:hypothetical protein
VNTANGRKAIHHFQTDLPIHPFIHQSKNPNDLSEIEAWRAQKKQYFFFLFFGGAFTSPPHAMPLQQRTNTITAAHSRASGCGHRYFTVDLSVFGAHLPRSP